MTSLFSIFDPATSSLLSLNWFSSLITFIMLPLSFWFIPSRYSNLLNIITTFMINEFKTIKSIKSSSLIFISLFLMIMINNIMGLFPYIFTSSSHLVMSMSLALPLWLSFMLFGWINNYYHMFIHLVPLGTPALLMPFMVIIETISNIIRPITLSVRLSANMIAGHLLISLISSTMSSSSTLIPIILIVQNLMFILEISVAIIQSYVFSILSTLYCKESMN
uniref:ATP synthase subunit a n=1 Tax=Orussus occidentalis TaxID=576952 RepID=C4NCE7_ORUOC|nr:ATP synthase F0 subunit 6 [Orussus occidentalis]ACJ69698.1 ATP synthase F0 subunit 6 [Orussus occidentalis]